MIDIVDRQRLTKPSMFPKKTCHFLPVKTKSDEVVQYLNNACKNSFWILGVITSFYC